METRHSKFRGANSPSRWLSGIRSLGGLLLLTTYLLLFTSTQAQTLDDYLVIAAENNPGLKASYARYQASLERSNQPGLPNPELEAGIFFKPMERFMGNQQADIRLMQMFPWFGMIGTQKEEANQMALAQYQLFLEDRNQLLFQVKSTWYDMTRIQETIHVLKVNLEFLKKHEQLALIKYQAAGLSSGASPASPNRSVAPSVSTASGMNSGMASTSQMPSTAAMSTGMGTTPMNSSGTSMSEVLQIRIEIKELENTIAQQEADLQPRKIKFNQLLNRGIQEEINIVNSFAPIQLSADKLSILDSIKHNNPMLAMYDYEIAALDQQARMAKLDGRPMLGAGVNYMPFTARQENGMSMGGQDMVMPMLTMTLPIYRKRINSRIKETELLKESAGLERQKTENLLAMDWANAFRDWEDAERKIGLYIEQIELTEQNLNLLMTAFTADQAAFTQLLDAHHMLHSYELKHIEAINQQYQSLSMLEMLSSSSITLY